MQKVGFSLIDLNNNELQSWGNNLGQDVSIPNPLFLPNGNVVHAPSLGQYGDYRLVEKWIDGDASKLQFRIGETISFDGEKIIVTWQYRLPNEQEYADAIQKHIDSTAFSKQYADAVSLTSYVTSTNSQWKAEADTFVAWRDSVWSFAFNLMEQVKQGIVPQPTLEEVVAQLPQIVWPSTSSNTSNTTP